MKILVTGGAGFIGSNFIRHMLLSYPQYQIINFDKLTYAGNLENLSDLESNSNYTFIKGDICDSRAVDNAIGKGIDVIINFAAETHVDRSIAYAGDFVNTDVIGTYVLLEAVKKHKIKRMVHISTDEVYGSIEEGSFTEESTLSPNSPYAASKAGGDLLVRSYIKTYGVPAIITRSSNNFGPFQYPEKLIPLFITNALEGQDLPLYGDGKNVRDWLYVEDNCRAIDLVAHHGKLGEIYNIAGENELQNIEITKLIIKKLGLDQSIIKAVKDRPGHDRRYSLSAEKIKKELGWTTSKSFNEYMEPTIAWYQSNRAWWEKIKKKQKEYQEFSKKWYEER
jgi:dTDP-glucose 4,6-dehydratase